MSTARSTPSEIAWAKAAAQKAGSISRLNRSRIILGSITHDELQQAILHMQQKHSSRRSTRLFERLQPIITHLRTFSTAIAVLTQADPVIACLVWGSIQLVVDAASAFSHTLDTVVSMLQDITCAMPRFDEYIRLYPERERLQEALFSIYCGYLDFCISAAKLFRCSVVVHLLRSFIFSGSLTASFQGAVEQIRRATKVFDAETHLAHAAATNKFEQVLPHIDISLRAAQSVFSVSRAQNARFFGRKRELDELYHHLSPHDSEQKSCVLHGMAGVGKTQTALEFCYQKRGIFPYIFWIPAEDEAQLAQAYSKITHLAGTSSSTTSTDLSSDIDEAYQWLCRNQNWLLVFDNADASELLNRYWPACGHGSILVTTQNRKFVHCTRSELHLKTFSEDEGSCLLLRHLPREKIADAKSSTELGEFISKEVKGLPLLLVGLAGHMIDSHMSLSETLGDLKKSWIEEDHMLTALAPDSATFQYEKPVHMAFNLSLNKVPPVAISVLRIMSMLSADAISEDLISEDLEDPSLKFLGYQDKSRFSREIRTPLVTRHLIEFHEPQRLGEPHSYSLHRQLQWKILNDMNTDHLTRQRTFDQSVALVRRAFPDFSSFMMPMYKEWHLYKKYIAHVMRLEEVFRGWDKSSSFLINRFAFAELLTKAGYYLREISLAGSGLAILGTAEQICQTASTMSAPFTSCNEEPNAGTNISLEAHDSINIGSVAELQATILQISWGIIATTQGLAGRQKSMENIKKVLRLRESYARMPHGCDKTFWSRVLLANAHNDMACQFLDSEQYSEAEAHLQTSLEMKDRLASERSIPPFLYAESKKNLAIVRLGQGKGEEVASLSQEAVNLLQKEDSHYSLVRFIHGTCLMNMGTTAEALRILEEVYTLCLATFGKAGMHTRNSLYAIALAQYRLERFEEARSAIAKCFGHQDERWWAPECVIRANYLHSLILKAIGEEKRAVDLGTATLTELESLLSTHSPELLAGRNVGRLTESEQMRLLDHAVPFEAGRFAIHQSNLTVKHR